jgi:FkbM family methyltransferase
MLDDPYFYRPNTGTLLPQLTSETKQEKHRKKSFQYVNNWNFAVDVGANVGHWTRDLSKKFKRVIAIEPQDVNIACFKKNIFADNVELLQLGLSDRSEETYIEPNTNEMQHQTITNVKCVTFDSLGITDPIDYIKVDIDGWEMPFLRGAVNTLTQQKNIVMNIEVKSKIGGAENQRQVFRLLQDWGFNQIDKKSSDFIFVK